MTEELPFRAGCFYDIEAIAAAFVSGGEAVSARTVRRWLAAAPAVMAQGRHVGGRLWLPGAALVSWLGSEVQAQPERQRDAARGIFVVARTEAELRRKVETLEVANG
jgi:hypothetical protein